jgi:Rrf2 family transcriptional regulator, iron-sulfur cluster assembly transcription factor
MRLTTKGRFAVTAMLDLALHANDGPVTLANISERQKISLSYLEQLFGKLRRNDLVQSVRGPGGGYNLAKPAAQLNVADIIVAVEEQLDSRQCEGREPCMGEKRCMTHDLWESLNDTVLNFLAGVTLADLVQKQNAPKTKTIAGPKSLLKVRPNNASRGRAGVETPLSVS